MTLDACTKACSADGHPLAGFDARTCLYGYCVTPNSVQLSTSAYTADGVSLHGLVQGAMLGVPYASVGCFADSRTPSSASTSGRRPRWWPGGYARGEDCVLAVEATVGVFVDLDASLFANWYESSPAFWSAYTFTPRNPVTW